MAVVKELDNRISSRGGEQFNPNTIMRMSSMRLRRRWKEKALKESPTTAIIMMMWRMKLAMEIIKARPLRTIRTSGTIR